NITTKSLGVRRAVALGQILPGIPTWQLGAESRFPGLVFVVFPGNVGDPGGLVDMVSKLAIPG
ncbi:MAG TPA: hydroxyacid dehydrogenase, partial [Dehalococcoidia bacterium]|nr:hydroxyacid dehydrogenase [Dehalococcoidia bacterium]